MTPKATACVLAGLIPVGAASAQQAFKDSAKFRAALSGHRVRTETFESAEIGLLIPEGSEFDGLTWSFDTTGPVDGGLIANTYGSIDTRSLYVERDGNPGPGGDDYFYPDEWVTVKFPTPVTAVGVYFNVGGAPIKGYVQVQTPVGTAFAGDVTSAETLHPPYFFAGLISDKPFDTVTFGCDERAPTGWNADNLTYVEVDACYPDLTDDGVLDLFDFLAFVNLFNAGDSQADGDGDAQFTLFDFLAFTNAFNTGC